MKYALGDQEPVLEGSDHFIAPGAKLIGRVRLRSHSSVWFNVVIRGDNDWIEIGERSNIQDGCILHTDPGLPLTVGSDVTVGHKAMLHGCTVGANTLVGIGSTILNGAVIGENCIVGAHALVTESKEFPPGSLIVGAPAKILRQLDSEEIAQLSQGADHYVANAARFREQLMELG